MPSTQTIGEIVTKQETEYLRGGAVISKYVTFDLNENINKIEAYLNSKHVSGQYDSKGRRKPFPNIVISSRNVWYRATDIDRSQIRIRPTKIDHVIPAYLATALLQTWMRRENFGLFLNEWGRVLAGYGSAITKFVKNSTGLHASVKPWNRMIVDAVEFDPNPKIEVLELTEDQLRASNYDEEVVESLIDAKRVRETLDLRKKDNKNDYYKLYELHGSFSVATLKQARGEKVFAKDYKTFTDQMYVYSRLAGRTKKDTQDFVLFSGEEKESPYMLSHLIKEDGRSQSIGAVENLFEAQWIMNHSHKNIKDQLDMSSKILFQTSDPSFLGKNISTDVDHGFVFVHEVGSPMTAVNNSSSDTTAWQNFAATWKALGNEINGISESMLGINAKAGSAWRQTEALLNESHSLFDLMTQNKSFYLEMMIRKYIIPEIKTMMDSVEEISVTLQDHGIDQIQALYVKSEAKDRVKAVIKDYLLRGETPPAGFDPAEEARNQESKVEEELAVFGNQRFLKPSEIKGKVWKDMIKDMEWELEIDIVGEQTNNQEVMTTLNTALKVAIDPNFANNPKAQFIVDKILTQSMVVSPIELASLPKSSPMATPTPQQTTVAG